MAARWVAVLFAGVLALPACSSEPRLDAGSDSPAAAPDVSRNDDSPCRERSFFADDDGDGWGDITREVRGCERPAGTVELSNDCDDGCASCHPGGVEVCDGADQDCNGTIDDGVTTDYYVDADGDGHGAIGVAMAACEAPPGHAPSSDDCDDACATCHPGSMELCDATLRDENCVGGVNEGCACDSGTNRACPGGIDTGLCVAGSQVCSALGVWGACEGGVGPALETCDGLDEDCDGTVDGSSATCPMVAHASPSCVGARCTIGSCDPGYSDCNADAADGCETTGPCSSCPPGCPWGCTGTVCHSATMVTTGLGFSCAVRDDARVACWGSNADYELGSTTVAIPLRAQLVPGLTDVTLVRAAHTHACAIFGGGRLTCWGFDTQGQLGRGLGAPFVPGPVEVTMPQPVVELAGGISHTCARLADGTVMCTGDNDWGQCGTGDFVDRYTFTPVSGLTGAVSLSGGRLHNCVARDDGRVLCWGNCGEHQCGIGTGGRHNVPVEMLGVTTARRVFTGDRHTCVLLADTSLACVGWNAEGQMGDGSTTRHTMAGPVPGLTGVDHVTVWEGSYAMVGSSAWVWGARGLLGTTYAVHQLVPVRNPLLDGFVSMDAADDHLCAIRAGAVWCWGTGRTLGDGVNLTSVEPRRTLPPP